eukprot:TRINITY_DN4971_c0_g1_i2.p1 TRINITY_DN4971_c0_g1~~TRINITY_DN4971_c0_g1_i2.p1  ORF type:complete len:407 (-),score=70.89 TRINITY_DN4971_c0_g1_i2:830-2050(-)
MPRCLVAATAAASAAFTIPSLDFSVSSEVRSGETSRYTKGFQHRRRAKHSSSEPVGFSSRAASATVAAAFVGARAFQALAVRRKGRRGHRRAESQTLVQRGVPPWFCSSTPAPVSQTPVDDVNRGISTPAAHSKISLWHDVDLFVRTWLDIPIGLLHYVNEMPLGSLKKYEVQPNVKHNVIREDVKGSQHLDKFGVEVPFNYGCFPQTFRDPTKLDKLYGVPGDDDPLDVLDLSLTPAAVGEVIRCRPLGAVCLIDEGQADWKILVVNVDANDPLSDASSVEEVERLSPGRIQKCLQWIHDFKQSCGKDAAKLHWEVHSAERASALIEEDHKSWKELLAEASRRNDGFARGHWICEAESKSTAEVLPVSYWPSAVRLQHQAPRVAVARSAHPPAAPTSKRCSSCRN